MNRAVSDTEPEIRSKIMVHLHKPGYVTFNYSTSAVSVLSSVITSRIKNESKFIRVRTKKITSR